MIAELAVSVAISVIGLAVVQCVRYEHLRAGAIWLAIPVGTIVYLVMAVVLVTFAGTLDPVVALTAAGVVGSGALVLSLRRGLWTSGALLWAGLTVVIVAAVVMLARNLHMTRVTVDSIRYLIVGADLQLGDAMSQVNRLELVPRQLGLPSLHAISSLLDRRYFTSIGPLFGVSGIGFFIWFTWRATRHLLRGPRLALALSATFFLLSSNRLLFDFFYINTHIEVAGFMLIAVVGSWLAVTTDHLGWMVLAGLALGVTLLFRPEAPLVVALILVAVGATKVSWAHRLAIVGPTVFFAVLWYGIVLWQNAVEGDVISLSAPVFGSLVALAGAVLVVLSGGLPRLARIVAYSDIAMLVAMVLALAGLVVTEPEMFLGSMEASFRNIVFSEGAWLLTWSIAVPLLVLALVVHQVPDARVWTIPIVGYAVLWFMLPMVRDHAWRVGPGDSGSRILAHMLLVVVAFLVLAAVRSWTWLEERPSAETSAQTVA